MNHITLAPMEGVIDYLLRELLSEVGGIDLCVTEFIRITDTRLPASVFHRICPELKHGCQTRSGTPVHIQLLGNNPELLAFNAAKAAKLGARGIDLNFGCPAGWKHTPESVTSPPEKSSQRFSLQGMQAKIIPIHFSLNR